MNLKASLTVEAALLVPFVTFAIFALVLLMLAAHDSAQLQAGADGEAETLVMAVDEEMDIGLLDRLRCIRHADASKYGTVSVPHGGIRALTGGNFIYTAKAEAVRVVYVEDYFVEKMKTGWRKDKTDTEGSR